MPVEILLGVAALAIAIAALAVVLVSWRSTRGAATAVAPAGETARTSAEAPARHAAREKRPQVVHRPQLAIVINPSKEGSDDVADAVRRVCTEAALPDPMFLETTVDDPGTGQARKAVEAGADIVVAAGGDGTVRAVAEALVGTDTPMGLIPAGTGNLLARNLDIPLTSVREALAVVLGGSDRRIDVGWARVLKYADRPEERPDSIPSVPPPPRDAAGEPEVENVKHIFLVIAGLGFDAAMVADTDDKLKAKVGWIAYFVSGVKHLHARRMRARITLDEKTTVEARLRTLMAGNCGMLPGGITLLPDAVIDDGELDIAAVDTRGGLAGWAQLLGEVFIQGLGLRNDLPGKIGRIDHVRAKRVHVEVAGGEMAQVDGDPLGRAAELEMWVERRTLVVRTGGGRPA
jgi:diacylglycerol kinase family enzyme